MRAIVHVQLLNVAGFLGVNVNFLERHQFRGQGDLPAKGLLGNVGYTDGDFCLRVRLDIPFPEQEDNPIARIAENTAAKSKNRELDATARLRIAP